MKILLSQKFGLGNQLFQYAAGLYFAEKYDAPLEIIREHDDVATSHGHPRPCLLNKFNISAKFRERSYFDRIMRSQSPLALRTLEPLRRLIGAHSHDPGYWIVGDYLPELPFPKGTRWLYLHGLFQVHQYAESMEPRLRKELTFRDPPTGQNLELFNQIKNSECPVSVHIRRGDYALEWQGRNLLPMGYYHRSIERIRASHPNASFFIFSDDIEDARKNLGPLPRATFVSHNTEDTADEDMRLMSACHHHIVANSTFSWWGAWLNPRTDKVVIAPDPWHTDGHAHILPPQWLLIPRHAAADAEISDAVTRQ